MIRGSLIRLEQLIAEVSQNPMPQLIGEAVDWIVSIERTQSGSRRVREVLSVRGHDGRGYIFENEETNHA